MLVVSEQRVVLAANPAELLPHSVSAGTVTDLAGAGCEVTVLIRNSRYAAGGRHDVVSLPAFTGLGGLLRHARVVLTRTSHAVRESDLVVIRVPGMIGLLASVAAHRHRVPYAVEVMGGFPPRAQLRREWGWALGFVFRVWQRLAKVQVRHADAALYVTQDALQRQFPTRGQSAGISDVQIGPEWVLPPEQRIPWTAPGAATLLFVGSLQHRGKGLDDLMRAMARLSNEDLDLTLTVVGEGRYRDEYQALARQLSVEGRITWLGEVTRDNLRNLMVEAHVLVLPSHHEGLPRVLVEAMACSLPCVATAVGGIVELADGCELVGPNDPAGLATAIRTVLRTPESQASYSRAASQCAQRFERTRLSEARRAFWRGLIAT